MNTPARGIPVALALGLALVLGAATAQAATHPTHHAVAADKPAAHYRTVDPLALVKTPDAYKGQDVMFDDTFVTFSPYGLDYKPALRSSKDYISFLVRRPDVVGHVIPLSELKLIYPRKKADKVLDLENGDKVAVKGRVFSSALGDPWMDVDEVTILQKDPENLKKGHRHRF